MTDETTWYVVYSTDPYAPGLPIFYGVFSSKEIADEIAKSESYIEVEECPLNQLLVSECFRNGALRRIAEMIKPHKLAGSQPASPRP